MAKVRKPVPKNQRDISIEQQQSFLDNPNDGITPLPQFVNQTDTATANTFRAYELSLKGDTVKPFTLGIQDIDEAIIYYFNNVIQPFTVQNGERLPIPVIYGNPERWKSVQKDGYYRDKNGKIMAPIIMFRRASMEKTFNIGNKLDANNPQNYAYVNKGYQKNDAYSAFGTLNNRKPVYSYQAVVIPDYVTLNYECVIWTYYIEQMNKIVESVNYASDSYWGDPARFKFNARIDSFTNNETLNQGEERIIKTNFSITMRGYIVPDIINKDLTAAKKLYTKGKLIFNIETSTDSEQYVATTRQRAAGRGTEILDSGLVVNNITNNVSQETLTYLNTNIQLTGTVQDSTTVTFPSDWIVAPAGLAGTSVDNFVFFCNGNMIEKTAITSFSQGSDTSTLIINTGALGYSFSASDEVIGIGKFTTGD